MSLSLLSKFCYLHFNILIQYDFPGSLQFYITSSAVSDVNSARLESEWDATWKKCCQGIAGGLPSSPMVRMIVSAFRQFPLDPNNAREPTHTDAINVAYTRRAGLKTVTELEVAQFLVRLMERIKSQVTHTESGMHMEFADDTVSVRGLLYEQCLFLTRCDKPFICTS